MRQILFVSVLPNKSWLKLASFVMELLNRDLFDEHGKVADFLSLSCLVRDGHVHLIHQMELSLLSYCVDILFVASGLVAHFSVKISLSGLGCTDIFQFLAKYFNLGEQLNRVDLRDVIYRDIRRFVFKSSVDEHR